MTILVSGSIDLASATFTDAAGNPTSADPSAITWTSSDPTVVTLSPAADGLSAQATGIKAGTATITMTVANTSITASGQIQVTAGPPAAANLIIGPLSTG